MTTDNILAPVASLALPDSATLTGRARAALDFIREFEIATAEDYGLAADELKAIKAKATGLETQRTAITGPINKALKAINDLFRGPTALLEEAESTLKTKMLAYSREQERIAAEARRKAEQAAEAERVRLAEQAAARQREAEAQALAAAQAQQAGDEQAAQLAQANAERAQAEAASAAMTAQLVVAAPVVAERVAVKGISTSTRIEFEVTDLHKLVQHIAEHPELISLVCADTVKLRAYTKGLGLACALPGVRVFEAQTMSARAA